MRVKEVMCTQAVFLPPSASLIEAAEKMQKLDCGFIPIGENDRLIGAVTDRDIVIRGLAKGKDPKNTTLRDIMTDRIEFCFEEDDLDKASEHMTSKQVHRLVVLDKNKKLKGVLSLGDIARESHNHELCGKTVEGVLEENK